MSVSLLLPLLLHNRYLHLGLITPDWVSEFGLTCGMYPVWCLDSFISENRHQAALTPSQTHQRTFSMYFSSLCLVLLKLSEQSDIDIYSVKNPPKLNDFLEIAIDH